MPKAKERLLYLFFLVFVFNIPLQAQQSEKDLAGSEDIPAESEIYLNLYIDCNNCDRTYIRESVTFVNHVRDLGESDIHVLVVNRRTGGGGNQYEFEFIGRGDYKDRGLKLNYFSSSDATWDEIRSGWVQKLMTGLLFYLADRPQANGFKIVSTRDIHEKKTVEVEDPWNYWVFDIDGNGSFQTESSQNRNRIGGDVSADRVTEDWKFRSRIYFNRNTQSFETDDGKISSISEWKGAWARIVKSMGPHFSSGFGGSVDASTFRNNDGSFSLGPAIEYSFFPYSEITRRILTLEYSLSGQRINYDQSTIYNKTEETLFRHDLEAQLRFITPTGYASVNGEFSQYLHDLSKNSIEFNGQLSQRLFKGFSVNLRAGMEIIHDQLYLPKGDASLEEVLLRQKQLATTFEYNGSIGLSYTFGSIYNNIVNSRL